MTALLIIIYVSFISLGLPDALLGAAWPVMSVDLGAPLSFAGVLSMIVAGGTIVSSLLSERVIRRFGAGKVTAFSVLLTAAALLGFTLLPRFWFLCLLAVPLGLGAGSVDTALNNFVALHYKVRHMNWLHCFWGVGATVGPIIMSAFLATKGGWRIGYGTIGLIQTVLVVVLFATLPLWKRAEDGQSESGQASQPLPTMRETLRTPGVRSAMLGFFAYCSLEMTTGLWGSSYLVIVKGIAAETAAQWISFYYFGITAGRFATGFLSFKLSNSTMIRLGMGVIAAGLAAVLLPFGNAFLQIGFALIGVGCAPIFPGMIHETPLRFGSSLSQRLIGLQMASAYAGSTFMPLLFGTIAQTVNIALLPYFLLVMFGLMVFFSENVNRLVARSALEKA